MDSGRTERSLATLLGAVQRGLDGRWRPLVPWGFGVDDVRTTVTPNPFAPEVPALAECVTSLRLRARVIWKVAPGWPLRASTEANADNVDELRSIIAFLLNSGEYPGCAGLS